MVASEETQRLPGVVTVMIAESRPVVSAGLRRLLSGQETVEVVADVADLGMLPAVLMTTPPDVLLLSHGLYHDLDQILREIRTAFPQTGVVVFDIPRTSDAANSALRLGVRGLIDEDASLSELVTTIHAVARGQAIISPQLASSLADMELPSPIDWPATGSGTRRLTARELEVLRLVANGLTNQGVAVSLGLSIHTIRAHLREIMRKLNTRTRIEAVALGIRLELVQPMDHSPPASN